MPNAIMRYSHQDTALSSLPGPQAEIYDTTRFEELYQGSRQPSTNNLGVAARYLAQVFQSSGIPFAFFGGWAMYLRGSFRPTEDLDIVVGTDMTVLKSCILQLGRVSVPVAHGPTSIQVFVHTSGEGDEMYPKTAVSLDIIIHGNFNTPLNIPNGTELITPKPRQEILRGTSQVPVVNMFFQFSSKLDAYKSRRGTDAEEKDYHDVVWLLCYHMYDIFQCRRYLDYHLRTVFFEDYEARSTKEDSEYVKSILGLDDTTLSRI